MIFIAFISFLIAQRLSELFVARRNEHWLRAQGAVEYGARHYPFIVLMHTLFIFSLIGEYVWRANSSVDFIFLAMFIVLTCGRIWVIGSLGKYWNTKIFRVPDFTPIRKGPYNYFRHPNYIVIVCEFIVIPMIFHLYCTAVVFTILNAVMLRIRINAENKAWGL